MVVKHSELTGGTHIAHNWEFPNEQSRLGFKDVEVEDLYKVAYQEDNGSWWVLKSVGPVTWHCLARSVPSALSLAHYVESNEEILSSERGVKTLFTEQLELSGLYLALVNWEAKTNSFSGAGHQFVISLDDEIIGRCNHKWGVFDQYDSGFFLTLMKMEGAHSNFSVGHRVLDHTTVTVRRIRTAFLRLSEM